MNATNCIAGITPSEQQEAIFAEVKNGTRNVIVRARAGTGKTKTIELALRFARETLILLCAFNKKIAEELTTRVAGTPAVAQTLHSVGFGLIRANWKGVRVDSRRGQRLAEVAANSIFGRIAPKSAVSLIESLASKGKGCLPKNLGELEALANKFDLTPSEELTDAGWTISHIAEGAGRAMAAARKYDGTIDYDDMVYVPVRNGWVRGMYELVIVDEAQDMNAAQLKLAQGVCLPGGRIIVVGDDRQAIYAFRGADAGALDRLKVELNAVELGLTTTYRCPQAVVALAAQLVPDYTAAATAPMGTIINDLDFSKLHEMARPGDFVLSRKNAPLAKVCLRLLVNGIRAKIAGRDIAAQILKIVRDLKATDMDQFMDRLDVWATKATKRITKANGANMEAKLDAIADQKALLTTLAEGMDTLEELKARIEDLFTETEKGDKDYVVCSSVHKAKGLEADKVFVLTETLYPGGRRDLEEQNIHYVAITRAKDTLVFVSGVETKDEE